MELAQLDINAVNQFLEEHKMGAILEATKFAGGQSNPTYLLNTTQGKRVLRRQPPGKLLRSAHAVDREYRLMKALAPTDVPVPEVYALCTDTQVIGSLFYLMEYVDGDIFWNAALGQVGSNAKRTQIYNQMNDALVKLHSVNISNVGLADYGKPGNYFARQFSRWSDQYTLSKTKDIPQVDSLIAYLAANLPDDDGRVAIVHGDFRLDNMVFQEMEEYRLRAILDWELSTLGHPFADLAYQCMQLRLPESLSMVPGLGGLTRSELGIPEEHDYVAQYCERRGIKEIENWEFYIAFSYFRLLAIIQGVVKRAKDGNASSNKAIQLEAMLTPLAEQAWAQASTTNIK